MTVAVLLCLVLFAAVFTFVQAIVMIALHTSQQEEARKQIKKVKEAKGFREFMLRKQIALKKHGADVFLSDGITVGQWYLYKTMIGAVFAFIALLITKGFMNSNLSPVITVLAGAAGWLFLDMYLRIANKSSNDEMMADICEMSRSVLYGKRGGQYIADALKDAVVVVENKRLKTSLIKMRNDL